MGKEQEQIHIFIFPVMSHGHMIPTMDMARLFAERGVTVSIITTHGNAPFFQKTIDQSICAGHRIKLLLLPFPSLEAGLPEGLESSDHITSPGMFGRFMNALYKLQQPTERIVEEHRPDCIISDFFLPWTLHIARKFKIPRLVFSPSSVFTTSAIDSLNCYCPYKSVASDTEVFILPGLPDKVEMTRSKVPKFMRTEADCTGLIRDCHVSESESDGIVVNSFYELERAYVDRFKKTAKKAWSVGPLSLCNKNVVDKAERGKKAAIAEEECLRWLDSKKPSSVVYICFGSETCLGHRQLVEIALALEAADRPFIWAVRNCKPPASEPWILNGFEGRMKGKGLIIRGWAPQILILNHPSVGAFVTHCGWNSVLEGVSAGVPMITWPGRAEQFFNEMLITQVAKIGVGVGVLEWGEWQDEERPVVKRDDIEKAIRRVMDGGDASDAIRIRARCYGEMAKKAVEEGGSSYLDVTNLIEETRNCNKNHRL